MSEEGKKFTVIGQKYSTGMYINFSSFSSDACLSPSEGALLLLLVSPSRLLLTLPLATYDTRLELSTIADKLGFADILDILVIELDTPMPARPSHATPAIMSNTQPDVDSTSFLDSEFIAAI